MPDNENRNVRESDRVWRVEQRYSDLVERLQSLERVLDEVRRKADQAFWAAELLKSRVDSLSSSQHDKNGGTKSILQDATFIKGIIAVLVTAMLAFATGRFFNIGG